MCCEQGGEKTSIKQGACERIYIFISIRLEVESGEGLGDDDDSLVIVVGKRYIVVADRLAIFREKIIKEYIETRGTQL